MKTGAAVCILDRVHRAPFQEAATGDHDDTSARRSPVAIDGSGAPAPSWQ